jgi:exopolyphosphatase/guanosine-5'-triphosphate,3'-diphosphate pyrophosphatase
VTHLDAPFEARILAGIDIGTLTCRLLIARLSDDGRLQELSSDRRILRLGEGVDRARFLRPEAMDRVITTLRQWRKAVEQHGVTASTVVATSAVRDAANRDEFLDRVKREAGFEVELITGEEEARRTLLGIRSGLPTGVTEMLALDIGGGSTEFILDLQGRPPIIRSIDIGVVRLSERILHHDPPVVEEIHQARQWVQKETRAALAEMPRAAGLTLVGTAGTITSLAAMAQQLPVYEPARIHNYTLTLETVTGLEQELLSRRKDQRRGMPGLEPGREEVIVAGAIILRTVMETLEMATVLVSDLGLREGVLIDLANRMRQPGGQSVSDPSENCDAL